MKKTILSLFLGTLGLSAYAATNISTPTVSGHWTLAGSPYNILNDIAVDASQTLTIDPGVQVIFQGAYRLDVNGMLYAKGTAAQQITFTVSDTTGWSTDTLTSAGGWRGIQYENYYGSATDTSAMEYCNITGVKIDATASANGCQPIGLSRPFALRYCNIYHNKTTSGASSSLMSFIAFRPGTMEVGNCSFYDNYGKYNIIYLTDAYGSNTYIHDCSIYQNTSSEIINGGGMNLLFQNNEVYNNTATGNIIVLTAASTSHTIFSHATIKGNKIHHNTTQVRGALNCVDGTYDIVGNLVSNNQRVIAGPCGDVFGGGGMFLQTSFPDSTFFNVRNNVIANNYSADFGGGIEIFQSSGNITNNQIINNRAPSGGAIYVFDDHTISDSAVVKIQNNIILNNISDNLGGGADSAVSVWMGLGSTISYDHNWTQNAFYNDIYIASYTDYMQTGDTLSNIVGTDPGLIAPTRYCTSTEDATLANFGLLPTSTCINMGDTTGISCYTTDYAGNSRIQGSAIDIGAYEFNVSSLSVRNVQAAAMVVYPNPATNTVYIVTPAATGNIRLADISGRTVLHQDVTSTLTPLDIRTLTPGMYFASWINGSGTRSIQKVIVQ